MRINLSMIRHLTTKINIKTNNILSKWKSITKNKSRVTLKIFIIKTTKLNLNLKPSIKKGNMMDNSITQRAISTSLIKRNTVIPNRFKVKIID